MANSLQAKKRIRQNAARRLQNRYEIVGMRSAIKKLKALESKEEAEKLLPSIISMIDKNAKRNLFHKNRAGNLKKGLMKYVATIGA